MAATRRLSAPPFVVSAESRRSQWGAVIVTEELKLVDIAFNLSLLIGCPSRMRLDVEATDISNSHKPEGSGVCILSCGIVQSAHRRFDIGVQPRSSPFPILQMPENREAVDIGPIALSSPIVLAVWRGVD